MDNTAEEWQYQLARRCEAEMADIRMCADQLQDDYIEDDALEAWRKDHRFFALVVLLQEDISLLCSIKRRCLEVDNILEKYGDAPSVPAAHDRMDDANDPIKSRYSFTYFRRVDLTWRVCFKNWNEDNLLGAPIADDRKGLIVAEITGNFALLDAMEDVLISAPDMWEAWGSDSLDVQDGIRQRIKDLKYLEETLQSNNYRVGRNSKVKSIKEIRKSLRQEKKQIADPLEGHLRVRKRIQAAQSPIETDDLVHSEQGSNWLLQSLSRLQNASPSILPTTKSNLPLRKTGVRASLLTIITLATIVGSTVLVLLSMSWNDGLYASWSQTLLLLFQAVCSTSLFDDSQKSAKLTRLPIHFRICVGFGAICALTSSAIYRYHETSATFLSFLANVGQAASAIVIARKINDSGWENGSEDDALKVHREI